MSLAAFLLLLVSSAFAAEPLKTTRVEGGLAIETGPLLAEKDAAARYRLARAVLLPLFVDTPSLGSGFAALLADASGPGEDLIGAQAVLQTRRRVRLFVNRFHKDGTILELVGTPGPDPSGLAPEKHGVVMSMRRVPKVDDQTVPFGKQRQYFGGDAVVSYRYDIKASPATLPTRGATVTRSVEYTLQRRDLNDWSWRPETKEAHGEAEVLYSDQNLVEIIRDFQPITLLPALGGKIPCPSADVSDQFFDDHERSQGLEPVCHVFAATAVLEAALKRAYGRKVPLADWDLARQLFPDGNYAAGSIVKSLQFAIERGVATKRSVESSTPRPGGEEEARRALGRAPARTPGVFKSFDDERRSVRDAFREAGIEGFYWPYTSLTMGVSQKYELIKILCAGEPAAVGMNLGGLEEWSTQDRLFAGHAFLVVGFEQRDGKFVFHTRNSWSGRNPDVTEDQLSRVMDIVRVKVGKPGAGFEAARAQVASLAE